MPATVTTEEKFDKSNTDEPQMKAEVELRILAGAIKSNYQDAGDNWILSTEWNVIGQQ